MSFILDALKRSDRNRERSDVPGLNTVHDLPPEKGGRKGRLLLPYLLSAGLLLNGGALLWWQFSGQEAAEPAPAVASPSVAEAKPAARRQVPAPSQQLAEPSPVSVQETVSVQAKVPEPQSVPVPEKAMTQQLPEPVQETVVAAGPVEAQMPPLPEAESEMLPAPAFEPVAEAAPSLPRIFEVGELPAQVRRTLPDISFSLHFYTEAPAQRMVRIDGRMLREGDSLPGGLRVLEITSEGVILEFRGYSLRLRHRSSG